MIVANKDKTAPEIIKLIADHYGYAEVKKEKENKKKAALEMTCKVPANVPLLMAFSELADLYFAEGSVSLLFISLLCSLFALCVAYILVQLSSLLYLLILFVCLPWLN